MCDAFGRCEVEDAASFVVLFLQCRAKGWAPFTWQEISDYSGKDEFACQNRLHGLIKNLGMPADLKLKLLEYNIPFSDGGWLFEQKGLIYVSDEFVLRCY